MSKLFESTRRWKDPHFLEGVLPILEAAFDRKELLSGADLKGASIGTGVNFPPTLLYANLFNARLEDSDFSEAKISTNFVSAQLARINFDRTAFDTCNFARSSLRQCTFRECNIDSPDLDDAKIIQCSFDRAVISSRRLHEYGGRRVLFDECDFQNTAFKRLQFRACTFRNCNFEGARFKWCHLVAIKFEGKSPDPIAFENCTS